MIWVTCGQFFVSLFLSFPDTVVRLFPTVHDSLYLKRMSLLMLTRWCSPSLSWPHLLQQQVGSIIGGCNPI
jgi:hypothetical protein